MVRWTRPAARCQHVKLRDLEKLPTCSASLVASFLGGFLTEDDGSGFAFLVRELTVNNGRLLQPDCMSVLPLMNFGSAW